MAMRRLVRTGFPKQGIKFRLLIGEGSPYCLIVDDGNRCNPNTVTGFGLISHTPRKKSLPLSP